MLEVSADVAAVSIALLLVLSGVSKLLFPQSFQKAVRSWGFAEAPARFTSVTLPVLEVVLGALAIGGTVTSSGETLTRSSMLALMVVFGLVQAVLWRRRTGAQCGCFARSQERIGASSTVRVAVLALGLTASIALG
jgi:hypothetical protein